MAASAGLVFAYILVAGGLLTLVMGQGLAGLWYVLIGWFLREASAGAVRDLRMDQALSGLSVGDAMTRQVDALPAEISLDEAVRDHFLRTGFGGYPVQRGDNVVGLVSLKDVMDQPADARESTSVQAVMTPIDERFVVAPDLPLAEATAKLAENGMGRLLVMLEGRLVGLLTLGCRPPPRQGPRPLRPRLSNERNTQRHGGTEKRNHPSSVSPCLRGYWRSFAFRDRLVDRARRSASGGHARTASASSRIRGGACRSARC